MKQLKLFSERKMNQFGGSLMKGHRKTTRPFNSTKPIHLVLKATNPFVLLQNRDGVERDLRCYGKTLGVHVNDVAVNADHIHLIIRGSRDGYHRWIRGVTSVLVRRFAGLRWKFRPFTRIGNWGRSFVVLKNYIWKNREEGQLISSAEKLVAEFAIIVHRRLDGLRAREWPKKTTAVGG